MAKSISVAHIALLERDVHKNKHLQSAWNYYGTDAFHFCVVEDCCSDQLLATEQKWIDANFENSYNLTKEAFINKLSAESRLKISNVLKGRKRPYIKRNCKNGMKRRSRSSSEMPNWKGRKHKEETKLKISLAMKNRKKALDSFKNSH